MLRKSLFVGLLLSLLGLLSSCQTMVPDINACTELDMDRGWCITTISGKGRYIDDQNPLIDPITNKPMTWWQIRPVMVQIPYFDYIRLKKWIILECKKNPRMCDARVSSWQRSLENLDQVIIQK